MGGMKDLLGDDLFSEKPQAFARHTDPETSHAAAQSIESEATRLEGIVYQAVRRRGEHGLTWDEAGPATGLPAPSISPRWKPLRKKELIRAKVDELGNVVKRAGKSGRGQIVWISTT